MKTDDYKILLADDDPDAVEFLSYNLRNEGYRVYKSYNGNEAISSAEKVKPELILLDIMMPDMNGLEVCRKLKKIRPLENTMIAFLTARSDDESFIEGFEAGCDDYIKKPIRPKVLSARIKALLRRYGNDDIHEPIISHTRLSEDLIVQNDNHMIIVNEKEFIIPAKEFKLLELLISKPQRVFNRLEIYRHLWGIDGPPNDRVIDVYIRKLRERVGENRIKTVKGIGYKFME